MFTLEQIQEAHSHVKSGVDFPAYVQDIIKLGVRSYDIYVTDGHAEYVGLNDYRIQSEPKYEALNISNVSNTEQFKDDLEAHQCGETDYMTFCKHAAQTGVVKWTVDTDTMTCTYYDENENKMIEEIIPAK